MICDEGIPARQTSKSPLTEIKVLYGTYKRLCGALTAHLMLGLNASDEVGALAVDASELAQACTQTWHSGMTTEGDVDAIKAVAWGAEGLVNATALLRRTTGLGNADFNALVRARHLEVRTVVWSRIGCEYVPCGCCEETGFETLRGMRHSDGGGVFAERRES